MTEDTVAVIETKDASGNKLIVGGEMFRATVENENNEVTQFSVVDRNDGSYSIRIRLTQAGNVRLVVTLNSNLVGGRKKSFFVTPGGISASSSVVSGSGLRDSMVGVLTQINVLGVITTRIT